MLSMSDMPEALSERGAADGSSGAYNSTTYHYELPQRTPNFVGPLLPLQDDDFINQLAFDDCTFEMLDALRSQEIHCPAITAAVKATGWYRTTCIDIVRKSTGYWNDNEYVQGDSTAANYFAAFCLNVINTVNYDMMAGGDDIEAVLALQTRRPFA